MLQRMLKLTAAKTVLIVKELNSCESIRTISFAMYIQGRKEMKTEFKASISLANHPMIIATLFFLIHITHITENTRTFLQIP